MGRCFTVELFIVIMLSIELVKWIESNVRGRAAGAEVQDVIRIQKLGGGGNSFHWGHESLNSILLNCLSSFTILHTLRTHITYRLALLDFLTLALFYYIFFILDVEWMGIRIVNLIWALNFVFWKCINYYLRKFSRIWDEWIGFNISIIAL
jgi:hypothetical protein